MVVKDLHHPDHAPRDGHTSTPADRFRAAVEHGAHLLPAQGPINVFIHHNTLHAFEALPFETAVAHGAAVFGCEPYLTEARYRDALAKGRIRFSDLREVLADDLGGLALAPVKPHGTRLDLRLAMLQYPLAGGTADELRWLIAETDALTRVRPEASAAARGRLVSETRRWVMRDLRGRNGTNPAWMRDLFARFGLAGIETWPEATWEAFALEALWALCREGARATADTQAPAPPPIRHRDLLLRAGAADTDLWVHDVLTRFTAAFLDQGVSHWPLPGRELGYFKSFCALYSHSGGPPDRWMAGLPAEARALLAAGTDPAAAACDALAALGVPESEWDAFVGATLLPLRGWAGMVHQVETRGDRVALPVPGGSLVEFVAVRLLLEKHAAAYAARESLGDTGPLARLRERLRAAAKPGGPRGEDERAFPVFQLAQLLGWGAGELAALGPDGWAALFAEVDGFPALARRRAFHLAYERRFREQCLDALALHAPQKPRGPRFQAITCLDEREESFRRHLEEVAPDCETFGAAGFFAVPMYYKGAGDAHFVPLCPIVLTPAHWVEERPTGAEEEKARRLKQTRRLLGSVSHRAHVGTRTFAVGALLTATLGVLASVPLVLRILFPRLTARLRGRLGKFVAREPGTALRLERAPECAPAGAPGHLGFTVPEMATQAERLLRDIGLVDGFARLVFVIGHGSNSFNNPHKSAYDCGACGGSPGAPNGRAAAAILNDARVRARLAQNGIAIPAETWFVGGYHNTCDDSVTLLDTEGVPDTHRDALRAAGRDIEQTCARNAHERCRRFMSAPLTLSPQDALRHVEGRSEDLAQTRPELGHATNALCVVGRRERTRGLFLDRRAFLTAYDPTRDDAHGTVLARTMAAVFPVCGGINLEYFFSHVDSPGYGCGTKLPHNITALLGVMDGAASDLRTGLPWQMVEIHEPVRLLIVCETTVDIMQKVLDGNPMGRSMTENGWVQLAVLSPTDNTLKVFRDGAFRDYAPTADALPAAASSADWYRGWREHLEFAEIAPGAAGVEHV
ncbi:hypothetical protein GobsT_13500 [Gemmata obscuriglobus]|uniref:DUF2309 domain-containing protein n=1 Tax=Gemmata obscuriglobus TaxID=114 RepID=UPI00016C363D|nr:DUF2309 domain-containing protein [Gemmata obscuriglobus]QEG26607.1 hypothetical protein GobsT_13500 [Gemmata obscuriglobus]VTS02110.1 UPF0753 protein Sinac_5055 OS=Singulisphaera acidiphila (strain ATCC BAA-1392 / DSM 18658 / VKM B-2454 / MOB10) GN=Sinac_5055 PE=3 SV=1: DUF2309 [Gemmata obscuriglobus UQM 2246]